MSVRTWGRWVAARSATFSQLVFVLKIRIMRAFPLLRAEARGQRESAASGRDAPMRSASARNPARIGLKEPSGFEQDRPPGAQTRGRREGRVAVRGAPHSPPQVVRETRRPGASQRSCEGTWARWTAIEQYPDHMTQRYSGCNTDSQA